ncbi:MAG: glycoside hydrolase family 30 protein [Breznakibacter sp.]|nr:glycoside hydrolase family 30 protein [Breznakibacter sp.]
MKQTKLLYLLPLLAFGCSNPVQQKTQVEEVSLLGKSAKIYATEMNSDKRLAQVEKSQFGKEDQSRENEISVYVNPEKSFQTMLGVGGAITDASAEVFAKLPADKQEQIVKAYYSKEGINYKIIRTNIHSCDFSSGSYTYITEGDSALTSFSIEHDQAFKIPLIKKAMAAAKEDVTFFVSPWSPPAFMKDNNNMLQGGKLLPKFYQSWANYYVKTIKAYEKEGMPVWGLTVQNEPMAVQRWESCIYTAQEERDFLKNYLGPTLKNEGLGDKNIVVWDHNRDLASDRANIIFDDPEAAKYAWGTGIHWYETWSGATAKHENIANIKESYPDKGILFTEGCVESFSQEGYQRWSNGERYGRNMINDFNTGVEGWTDWNILLDETGGPNHVGNLCFAPIHGDTKTGEVIITPSYYYIGHFSKFMQPKAVRVSTTTSRSTVLATTFRNPDGSYATIVMNQTDETIPYKIYVNDSAVKFTLQPHSIQTVVY